MARDSGNKEVSRRGFLSGLIWVIGGAIGAAVSAPLIGYFLSPIWKKTSPLLTVIARTSDIPVGVPTFVTFEHRIRDGWFVTTLSSGAWILNKDGKDFVIFDPRCTHLNCPYYWDKQKQLFQCPCHDGRFDIDGNVLAGPPPRPLDRLQFVISEGNIQISGKRIGEA